MNNFKVRLLSVFMIAALLAAFPNSYAQAYSVVFVDCDATGENDGSSWKNAYTDLQSALLKAHPGSEIWVVACVYKPTTGSDRSISFRLKNGVALYGGFAGNEDSLAQRDLAKNVTILSGDIGVTGEARDNSYHVIVSVETDTTTILDGFTVTDGNANSDTLTMDLLGGGMYNIGNPTLRNVTFSNNSAYRGGGMYNAFSGPTLSNVIFSKNSSSEGGGGMYNSSSSPTLGKVTFSDNIARYAGGGMFNTSSNPTLTDVTFSGNTANYFGGGMANRISGNPTLTGVIFDKNSADCGGGMSNYFSHPTLTDVTFSGNTAIHYGGGMDNSHDSNPILTDVTFSENSSDSEGGGMRNEGPITLTDVIFDKNSATSGGGMTSFGDPTLTNVTFSGNTATDIGGGMTNHGGSILTNVTFSGNTAGSEGGGMYTRSGHPTLTDVTLSGNTAGSEGGGMLNDGPATLTNVTFDNNSATSGGGMTSSSGGPALTDVTLTNVTFSGNTATDYGGGMVNRGGSTLTNVTFSENSADSMGGGMFTGGPVLLRNTILWGNTAPDEPQVSNHSTNPVSIYDSVVQDDCPKGVNDCMNIIADDPRLGTLGNYGGNTHTIPLDSGSSAIDTGDDAFCPATDQRGVARPQGKRCDIGAYEAALIIDDMDPAWSYTGSWTIFASAPAYAGGIHYTTTVDDSAELTFTGSQFHLAYTGNTNRGAVDVYVDGVQIDTIDQYTATATYQKIWTSGILGAGVHIVKFVHAGPADSVVNIDMIEIFP